MALSVGVGRRTTGESAHETGAALLMVVLSLSTVLGLGLLLAWSVVTDRAIAATAHEGRHTVRLSEALAEQAMADLAVLPVWDDALGGAAVSSRFDGATGVRLAAGQSIDLGTETARMTCGLTSCVGVSTSSVTALRPWGANNPLWRVYASGESAQILGGRPGLAGGYAVVWIADDGGETDGDPLHDGGPPVALTGSAVNPGADVVWLRAVAWGPRGSRRELHVSVERENLAAHTGLRVRTWRELRGAWP